MGRAFLKFAVLHHENIATDELKKLAQDTVPPQFIRRAGKSAERYRSYWSARVALKQLIGSEMTAYSVIPDAAYGFPQILPLDANKGGAIYVSLAHTDCYSVAAIASAPVGVDLEKRERDASKVMKRVCTDEEFNFSQSSSTIEGKSISNALALWTAKEAYSKALGLGMKFGFQALQCNFENLPWVHFKTALTSPMTLTDPAGQFFAEKDLVVALVSERALFGSGVFRRYITRSDLSIG